MKQYKEAEYRVQQREDLIDHYTLRSGGITCLALIGGLPSSRDQIGSRAGCSRSGQTSHRAAGLVAGFERGSANPERIRNTAVRPNNERTPFDFVERESAENNVATRTPSKAMFRDHVKWQCERRLSATTWRRSRERSQPEDTTWTESRMCSLLKVIWFTFRVQKGAACQMGSTERKKMMSSRPF